MSNKIIKLTALQRALAEAHGFSQRGDFDQIPPSDNALRSLAAELKALRKKVVILYVGTTLGAFLILSNVATNASIEILGASLPLSVLSRQALAVLLAGAFGYYAAAVISAVMVYGTMSAILQRFAPESWEFLLSRYDADQLWTNMLLPKKLGAPSPRAERVIAGIVNGTNKLVVSGHITLIVIAVWASLTAAIDAKSLSGIVLGALAVLAVLGTALGAVAATFLKLKYKLPE